MKQPKVSIITPSFNRGHLIENTIKSVLGQEYENIEYIIVDGKSTDNTLEILERYAGHGRLIYISEPDNGMYDAINKGIRLATGDIVSYVNSDDMYFPWTVQRAVDVFQNHADVDMVYGDSMVFDSVRNRNYLNIYNDHKKYWLETGGVLCQPTVFLRKRIIESIGGFNTEYQYLADCEYWLRVNNHAEHNIMKLDEVMALELNHGGTFRETVKTAIEQEKRSLREAFSGEYENNRIYLYFLKGKNFIGKEIKLWKFILANRLIKCSGKRSWADFLKAFNVKFSFSNYLMCKLCHSRKEYPRFSIVKKDNER